MQTAPISTFIHELLQRSRDTAPCSDNDSLISSNRLDSINIAELIIFLQDQYDIYVSTSDPDIFKQLDSINLIAQYIQDHQTA
ncbi:acyl carrier protein [Celerinatantimonas sp. YJH-8]|uniref:acyl carrier protein n=1 Tax=Celerinatantimonas sp. YJH-8 TaxID=3228714 RepID=UPI0038C77C3B